MHVPDHSNSNVAQGLRRAASADHVTIALRPDIYPVPMSQHDASARFESLFDSHYQQVLSYVLRRAPEDIAEDVLAETFIVAWRRFERIPDDPLPWLLGVARRLIANHLRGDSRRKALIARLSALRVHETTLWEPASSLSPELASALSALSSTEREALLLTAWDGLAPQRAAAAAGCSAGAFRVRLHRARTGVAAHLDRTPNDAPIRHITREAS